MLAQSVIPAFRFSSSPLLPDGVDPEEPKLKKHRPDRPDLRVFTVSTPIFDGLGKWRHYTSSKIKSLKGLSTNCKMLDVSGNKHIRSENFKNYLKTFKELEVLLLAGCTHFNDSAVGVMPKKIRVLDVSYTPISSYNLVILFIFLKNLESLYAEKTDFNKSCLMAFRCLENLRVLYINQCGSLKKEDFAYLKHFPKLEEIYLSRTQIDRAGLESLPLTVTHLDLRGCPNLNGDDYQVLLRLENLQSLVVDQNAPHDILKALREKIPGLEIRSVLPS